MTAGKELDALVAEKVMGWTRWANARGEVFFFAPDAVQSEYIQSRISEGALTPHAGSGDEGNAPEFSTYIAAAWKVLEKMHADGFSWEVSDCRQPEFAAAASFVSIEIMCGKDRDEQQGEIDRAYVLGETAPLAICLAALKACGVGVRA